MAPRTPVPPPDAATLVPPAADDAAAATTGTAPTLDPGATDPAETRVVVEGAAAGLPHTARVVDAGDDVTAVSGATEAIPATAPGRGTQVTSDRVDPPVATPLVDRLAVELARDPGALDRVVIPRPVRPDVEGGFLVSCVVHRRRADMAFGPTPVPVRRAMITREQEEALLADPMLTLKPIAADAA